MAFLVAIAGFATTVGSALAIASVRAEGWLAPRSPSRVATAESSLLVFERGESPSASALGEAVFPWERYVVDGATEWEPLLVQWRDREYLTESCERCRSRIESMPADDVCQVDYTFFVVPDPAGAAHRITYSRATLASSTPRACREYVQCRLAGYLGAKLPMPEPDDGQLAARAVTDRVQYSSISSDPTELRQAIEALEERLDARPTSVETTRPGVVDRYRAFRDRDRRDRLSLLRARVAEVSE